MLDLETSIVYNKEVLGVPDATWHEMVGHANRIKKPFHGYRVAILQISERTNNAKEVPDKRRQVKRD